MTPNELGNLILGLVTVVGLFFTVGKPIINLNTNITKMNVVLDNLKADQMKFENNNTEFHSRLWDKNTEQDKILNEHEKALSIHEGAIKVLDEEFKTIRKDIK